jgi:hypothetical protein
VPCRFAAGASESWIGGADGYADIPGFPRRGVEGVQIPTLTLA